MELEKCAQALVAPAKASWPLDESFPSINTQFAYTGDALCHSKETVFVPSSPRTVSKTI
jgi:hypothetical protein